ncbi:MAG: MerR family transcriptional regulator [Bosea sp. (in: a-proteobacteria)]|uniref:MerR family transcriptional regulator n=1 Tax=Bosea sp. (in: a-proteobacteria) TaxID=1871050 RepID=UPI003F7C0F6F
MRIGELARRTGVTVETIRWYEKAGLIEPPARSASNYRDYDAASLARLSFIKRGRELGFSLDQVVELMALARDREGDCGEVDAIARGHLATIERKIADLTALRRQLGGLIAACEGGEIRECNILCALAPAGTP